MESSSSRYDLHAEWFLDYTRDWGSVSADYLPDDLGGRRVLDLACGYGTLSRVLAERGAHVTGVDLSARLVAHAQEIDGELGHGSVFVCGDAASTDWWDGRAFSDVVCNMALMDVDDLDKAMSTVATILQPDGRFTFTLFHPCFPGEGETLPSWPPDLGYAAEGWWTTGESGVRGHVGANHRMLSTYLNAVLHAGLEIVESTSRVLRSRGCWSSMVAGRPVSPGPGRDGQLGRRGEPSRSTRTQPLRRACRRGRRPVHLSVLRSPDLAATRSPRLVCRVPSGG